MIFVDDYTRYTRLYSLRSKYDFFSCFLKFQVFVEKHFDRKIKTFQSDGGGEFISIAFTSHLAESGISKQLSYPHTPK